MSRPWLDGRTKAAKLAETQRAPRRKRGEGRQTWTVCRKPGCDRKLRSDNRSGFCKHHHTASGQCSRCLAPCTRNHPVCWRCRVKNDREEAVRVAPCTAVGCTVRVHGKTGLCKAHYLTGGGVCAVVGCSTRIVFESKTGLCRRHHDKARSMRRRAAKGKQ